MKTSIFWVGLALSFSTLIGQAAPPEPLGPASRATGLVISEIFYGELTCCVIEDDDDDDGPSACWHPGEFIEIYNSNPYFENLSGLKLAGNISRTFQEGMTIPAGGFLVLRGEYDGSLTGCEGVRLLDKSGAVLAAVNYTNTPPWPLADGTGHSIVLSRPSYGQGNPKAWSLSNTRGGSPGAHEPGMVRPSDAVRINEYGLATEIQYFFELYNHSNVEVDLSEHWLVSSVQSTLIPTGTVIAARGFVVFHTAHRLSSPVWLKTPDENHIIDAAWPEIYQGRYPDGTGPFIRLTRTSPGAPNLPPARGNVVINEIMYAPISGNDDDEYIELYNRGQYAWTLGGTIAGGIHYTIPSGTVIAPSNYLVIARNPQRLLARYPHLSSSNVVGGYSGDLDDNGEHIRLIYFNTLDEVTYGVGGQWGEWSRGGGSSLELKDTDSDGRYAHNWADSDETGKGVWTTIERTAAGGEALGGGGGLQIFLLGAGECLVDEVEARNIHGAGPNLLATNPGFEAGMTGWTPLGSHDHSVLAQEGFAGSRSLRLRAATVGDNGPNRVRSSPLNPAPAGEVLLRMRVKWLRGSPEIALRVQGGGWEASGRMDIQANGTPGLRNSRAVANAGPAIAEVSHHPPLPAANESVRITAMFSDPDDLRAQTYFRARALPFTLPQRDRVC